MRKFFFAVNAFLVLGLAFLVANDKAPAIVFDSLNKDFGKVTEGESLKHIFKFTNKGLAPLENLKAEGS